MANATSANLKLTVQTTGENSGTWGQITNTNLLILEHKVENIETSSGTITSSEFGLSSSEREYDANGLNYKISIGYSF